jgi:hypothetical protein
VTLSDLIRSHGWVSNNEVVEALQQEGLEMMAEWVRVSNTANSVFGIVPGISWYADQHNVTEEQAAQVVVCIADNGWFFQPLLSILKTLRPLIIPVEKKVGWGEVKAVLEGVWEGNNARFCDREYAVCSIASLEEAIKATGYKYGAWVEEEMDCDEWAGRLWGALQRANPGNLAIGYVTICGNSEGGNGQCHALLLALCSEGLVWIENTGKVYGLGELPGWQNDSIRLDVALF